MKSLSEEAPGLFCHSDPDPRSVICDTLLFRFSWPQLFESQNSTQHQLMTNAGVA